MTNAPNPDSLDPNFKPHLCVTLPASQPFSTFPHLHDFCRQEAIEGHYAQVKKSCGDDGAAPFHVGTIDSALRKMTFQAASATSEVAVTHGRSGDLLIQCQGLGDAAYPTFWLIDIFLSECQALHGDFSVLFLTRGFPAPPILSSTVVFPQFSLSSLFFHFFCVEEFTQLLGRKDRLPSAPRKGSLSWPLSGEGAMFLFRSFFPFQFTPARHLYGVISNGSFVILNSALTLRDELVHVIS